MSIPSIAMRPGCAPAVQVNALDNAGVDVHVAVNIHDGVDDEVDVER
ncbi:MAG TPA: hypothetical protein RMH99_25880 [Sandaracinaceae bacterium LLY-WYZ-13_1]|nr:hypothetical protein [Sandaracinaceae bacterium LLY-WYZ-13_1]